MNKIFMILLVCASNIFGVHKPQVAHCSQHKKRNPARTYLRAAKATIESHQSRNTKSTRKDTQDRIQLGVENFSSQQ